MANKTIKNHQFLKGMAIYACAAFILIIAAMRIVWGYMDAYEETRPNHTLDNYIASFRQEHILEITSDFLNAVDTKLQSKEQVINQIEKLFEGEIKYLRKEGNSERTTYNIVSDKRIIGTVTIAKDSTNKVGDTVGFGPLKFDLGFEQWNVIDESFDFNSIFRSSSITVPESYTVALNGNILNEAYISRWDIPFEILEEFAGSFNLPTMVTYTVDKYVGEAEFTVNDPNGKRVIVPEGINEELFLDDCTEEIKADIYEFGQNFINAYIKFSGNVDKNVYDNLSRLQSYIVPGSRLSERMREGVEGLTWAHSKGDTMTSLNLNHCMNIGNGYYMADFTYEVDTIGNAGHVTTTNNVKLMISTETGKYLTASMTSY